MTKPPSTLDAYLKNRLVPREPDVPELSAEDVRLVETTVFVKPDPLPSDLLFIFGSSNNDWQFVADLYRRGVAPTVLVTGRAGEDYYATGVPQAHRICEALQGFGVPREALLVEDGSDNTLENAVYGRKVLEQATVKPRSISFVCKSHHSGRAWRTVDVPGSGVSPPCGKPLRATPYAPCRTADLHHFLGHQPNSSVLHHLQTIRWSAPSSR